ncbi:MAG: hypothetical protein JWM91_5468 [Rhodospirillales bacterium]|nr:hypothetical protein [Rhodospirillales bacterium]
MASTARISIADGQFLLVSPDTPDLTKGRHRLFFSSIAGLNLAEEFLGYVAPVGAETVRLIEDISSYLEEDAVALELDETASRLLRLRKEDQQQLDAAREFGAKVREGQFERPQPPGFQRTLKPYQEQAVAHMIGVRHAANFSVPGSGKTTMVLAAFAHLKATDSVDRILVIGPRSCFMPWDEEFTACFGRGPNSIRISGTKAERRELYRRAEMPDVDLILASYQMAANDLDDLAALLQKHRFMLVLDESHYIKRMSGGVWANSLLELSAYAVKRVVLTGTPVPNGLSDLWSQMTFLWPSPPVLGSREHFQRRLSGDEQKIVEEVRQELRPLFWRVKKSDVKLPPATFHKIPVAIRPYQRAIYDALAAKVLAEVARRPSEREKLRQWRKARMVRLLQAASNPSLLTEFSPEFRIPPLSAAGLNVEQLVENYSDYEMPAKVDFARDLVNSLIERGQKVVLWTTFIHNITTLSEMLSMHRPRIVYGGVPKDAAEDVDFNRELMIRQFKTDDQYPLLIANPGACAESISLHRVCKHAIYLDRTFNGAQYMQSLDRIHRLGLRDDDRVHYHILCSEGTIDELIDRRLDEKRARLEALLEDDLVPVDLDDTEDVSEENEEAKDFEELILFLREKHSGAAMP